jgi:hypothetical protein
MKGDFTRTTFDAARHFSRVLMQQGRVSLDADWNEQTEILLNYVRRLSADLIGPYAAPAVGGGFVLGADANGKLTIGAGRYYVDGILVENEKSCLYSAQPYYPLPSDDALLAEMENNDGKTFWIYLDVWERHITHLEVPAIREVALGGPDTCSRAQVVWQVKAKAWGDFDCAAPLKDLVTISAAGMSSRVDPDLRGDDRRSVPPQARYRGRENHFYRIEVQDSGKAGSATFKWSRDNGSVVTAWRGTQGRDLLVAHARGFTSGCWVELIDDARELLGLPGTLVKLAKVEGQLLTVDAASITTSDVLAWSDSLVNPNVRRWDHSQIGDIVLKRGAVPIVESTATEIEWIDLEDAIQVQFSHRGEYRTGDYWTIPARVATGAIEWPADEAGSAAALSPFGIEHHYAPLGFVKWDRKELEVRSCRCVFAPHSTPAQLTERKERGIA